jgi:integrase
MKQQILAMAADQNAQLERYRRPTKRDAFLATMEQIVPWAALTNQDGKVNPNDDKPIAGIAAQALEAWQEASAITEGPIIRRILKGGRILDEGLDPTAIRKIVKQRCLQAGLVGDFSAHSLRSGFVTEAGRRRMDTADAMAMTGHRNYETTSAR